jgi:hypothetical protein
MAPVELVLINTNANAKPPPLLLSYAHDNLCKRPFKKTILNRENLLKGYL